MKKRIHTIKRSVRSIVHRIKRSVRKHNPGLGLGVFGLGNPHPSTKGLGHRMRLVGFRKGSTVRLSPFSLTARRMKGRVINPLETRTYHKGTHPKRSKSMKHRRSHRKYRRSNPFLPKNILPKNVFGKQMLGEVVGGTVGFFAVEKVPGLLPAAWGATGNTWQAWVSMVLTLLAGNFIIGNVLKKQDMAKSFFVGGTLAIVVKALKTNIPQLAGTGYFIPQRTLAGGVGRTMAPGTSAAQTLLTRTTHEQARHS